VILLKNTEDIKLLHKANMVVAQTLQELRKHIKPGITTEVRQNQRGFYQVKKRHAGV